MRTSNTSTGVSQNVASNLRGLFWDSLRFATSKTSRCRRQYIVASHPGKDTYIKVSNQFPKILRVIHQKFTSSNIDVFWKEFLPSPFLFSQPKHWPIGLARLALKLNFGAAQHAGLRPTWGCFRPTFREGESDGNKNGRSILNMSKVWFWNALEVNLCQNCNFKLFS